MECILFPIGVTVTISMFGLPDLMQKLLKICQNISQDLPVMFASLTLNEYTMCPLKMCTSYCYNNFGKCEPVLVILSLLLSQMYCRKKLE